MPWAAVPFADADMRDAISSKFGVSGIPAFIVINPEDCSVIDKEGRSTVSANNTQPQKCFDKWGI